MQLELSQVSGQLNELSRQQDEQARQLQAEGAVLIEREEAEREREEFQEREALRQAQVRARHVAWEKAREEWLKGQLCQATSKFRQEALWLDLETDELGQALSDLNDALKDALNDLSHESVRHEVVMAQDEVVRGLLRPFERRKEQNKVIAECRKEIGRYLREQSNKGWLDIQGADIDFLARQIEQPVMAVVERAVRSMGLSERQAEEYLYGVINRRLNLI